VKPLDSLPAFYEPEGSIPNSQEIQNINQSKNIILLVLLAT
jgi:hypothetical protein